jgi:hypothetical protein
MPEFRKKGWSGIGIFTVSQLCQSGIGIPTSEPVRYRWSLILAFPSFVYEEDDVAPDPLQKFLLFLIRKFFFIC